MATDTKVLDVSRTQLIQAPPARVLAAFFSDTDLKRWWQVGLAGWEAALQTLKEYIDREAARANPQ